MNTNSIANAENRVKEMNRVTRQFLEQSNQYMNNNMRQAIKPEPPKAPLFQAAQCPIQTPRFEQMQPQQQNLQQPLQPQQKYFRRKPQQPPPRPPMPMPPLCKPDPPKLPKSPQPPEPQPLPTCNEAAFPKQITLDSEKILIIFVIILLAKEKADIKLIIALGYLLF